MLRRGVSLRHRSESGDVHDPELGALQKAAKVAGDVVRVELGKDLDLLLDVVDLVLGVLEVDLARSQCAVSGLGGERTILMASGLPVRLS
jgi:hypothetical protein